MGFIDNGSQDKTYDFKEKGTSKDFNRINLGLAPGGIYKGGRVTLDNTDIANPQWVIAPFTAIFPCKNTDNRDIVVSITTESSATVPAFAGGAFNPATPGDFRKLRMRYIYQPISNNFIDFSIATLGDTLANEIVICRLTGQGTLVPPLVSYDLTSFGPSYEGNDERSAVPSLRVPFRGAGKYFRLTLDTYVSGGLLPSMTFRLPPGTGKIELIDEIDPGFKIEFHFANNPSDPATSSSYVKYPAGYKVSGSSAFPLGYISLFMDSLGAPQIINRIGSQKTFLCSVELSTFGRS